MMKSIIVVMMMLLIVMVMGQMYPCGNTWCLHGQKCQCNNPDNCNCYMNKPYDNLYVDTKLTLVRKVKELWQVVDVIDARNARAGDFVAWPVLGRDILEIKQLLHHNVSSIKGAVRCCEGVNCQVGNNQWECKADLCCGGSCCC